MAETYTPEQREAMATAYLDRGIRPAMAVVRAAAAGELTYEGKPLAPFETKETTVRSCYLRVRNRRAGKVKSDVAAMRGHDGPAALKRRLLAAADQELAVEENKRRGRRDIPRLQQIARMAREASAIPEPGDPIPVKPGEKIPGTQRTAGGKTSGGLAGSILQAAGQIRPRGNAREVPAQDAPSTQHAYTEQGSTEQHARTAEQGTEQQQHGEPGSWASTQVGAMQGA